MITVSNVANASQGELLCITYNLFLNHIEEAISKEGIDKQYHIDRGTEILKHLTENLNFETEIAKNLFQIYVYVQNLLINHRYQEKSLEEAHKLIKTIYDGYAAIVQEEKRKQPAMQNVENIYAGITYGKGTLNEMTTTNTNRGFRA